MPLINHFKVPQTNNPSLKTKLFRKRTTVLLRMSEHSFFCIVNVWRVKKEVKRRGESLRNPVSVSLSSRSLFLKKNQQSVPSRDGNWVWSSWHKSRRFLDFSLPPPSEELLWEQRPWCEWFISKFLCLF